MIAYLKGTVEDLSENRVVIEVNQIGYNVNISARDIGEIGQTGVEVKLHTYLQVREDAMQLFGFLSKEDLRIFQLLLNVNGIGPKAALGILSVFSANDLKFAVLAGDSKAISKAPGVGNKTAQKLILELKDKFDLEETFESGLQEQSSRVNTGENRMQLNEAVQALTALGYPANEALKAVRSVPDSDKMSTEELLKAALKKMAF